jgi:hypothetical protein
LPSKLDEMMFSHQGVRLTRQPGAVARRPVPADVVGTDSSVDNAQVGGRNARAHGAANSRGTTILALICDTAIVAVIYPPLNAI